MNRNVAINRSLRVRKDDRTEHLSVPGPVDSFIHQYIHFPKSLLVSINHLSLSCG